MQSTPARRASWPLLFNASAGFLSQIDISLQARQKATCDVAMQCAPRGGGDISLTFSLAQDLSEIFILLKKLRRGKGKGGKLDLCATLLAPPYEW